ncbi:MAG: VanZ family protein [Pseudomonadota bacterium]
MTPFFRLCAVLIALAIVYLSLQPPGGAQTVPHIDKLKHFVAYAALSGAVGLGWARLPLWAVVAMAALFGVGMEVAQGLGGLGRVASVADALANLAGATTAAFIVRRLRRLWA